MLKDGTLLCEFINALRPGSVKTINRQAFNVILRNISISIMALDRSQMPFKERENIEQYLEALRRYGQEEQDLFQVLDITTKAPII